MRPTATQRPSRNGWGYILLQPRSRILSSPLKCCCVSVVTGRSSQWHHWVKKKQVGKQKVSLTHKCLPKYKHRKKCQNLHCQMSEWSKDLSLAMEYFAFFFLHFRICIFYNSMYRECKYYLCKQNEWMNKQMRKKQNCIKVQRGTNF